MKGLEELDAIEDVPLSCPPGIIMGEAQLILAENRTSLASLRTGIAVAVTPMSIMGLLVATSRLYEIRDVLPLFLSTMAFSIALLSLGGYLIVIRLRREDRMIRDIKRRHSSVGEFIV